jgi:hypothetical protein
METLIKINIAAMKDGIKKAAEIQKFYKNQRKTVHIKGDRLMDANEATRQHLINREKLCIMYAVYGIARGKSFSQIENHYPEENHPLQKFQKSIDRILEGYKYLEEVPVKGEK